MNTKLLVKPKKTTAAALNLLREVYGEDGTVTSNPLKT